MKIDAEQRQLAKQRNHYLWSLTLDGGQRTEPEGVFEICGPLPPECHAELSEMVSRWTKERKV